MKYRVAPIFAAALLCFTTAHAEESANASPALDPVRVEKARALVEVTLPPAQRREVFTKILDAFMGNMLTGLMQADPALNDALKSDAEVSKIFSNFVARQRGLVLQDLEETLPELMLAYANAYARIFSADELDGLTAFLSTPLGQKYALRSREVLSDPDVGKWQQAITVRAQSRKKEEIRKLMDEIEPVMRSKGATSHGS